MDRNNYPSQSIVCAAAGSAPASVAVKTKRTESQETDEDVLFVSPVKRSFVVTLSVIVGGRVTQPPIDDDDIVYFDD